MIMPHANPRYFNEAGGAKLGGMGKRVGQAGHRSTLICGADNVAADACGGVMRCSRKRAFRIRCNVFCRLGLSPNRQFKLGLELGIRDGGSQVQSWAVRHLLPLSIQNQQQFAIAFEKLMRLARQDFVQPPDSAEIFAWFTTWYSVDLCLPAILAYANLAVGQHFDLAEFYLQHRQGFKSYLHDSLATIAADGTGFSGLHEFSQQLHNKMVDVDISSLHFLLAFYLLDSRRNAPIRIRACRNQ